MKEVTVVKYEAKDGKVFDNKETCEYYEKKGALMELIESDVGFTHADMICEFITDNRDSLLRIIAPRNLAEYVMIMSDLEPDQKFNIDKHYGFYFDYNSIGKFDIFNDSKGMTTYEILRDMLEGKVEIWV